MYTMNHTLEDIRQGGWDANLEAIEEAIAQRRETLKAVRPVYDYEVYFSSNGKIGGLTGSPDFGVGSQRRVIKAVDHKAAVSEYGQSSEYSDGCYFIAVGPGNSEDSDYWRVVKIYRVHKVDGWSDYDFRTTTKFHGCYKLTEVGIGC